MRSSDPSLKACGSVQAMSLVSEKSPRSTLLTLTLRTIRTLPCGEGVRIEQISGMSILVRGGLSLVAPQFRGRGREHRLWRLGIRWRPQHLHGDVEAQRPLRGAARERLFRDKSYDKVSRGLHLSLKRSAGKSSAAASRGRQA